MWAMVSKEFRELRRDRRTAAMMIVLPVVLLVVFGYAANFKVSSIPTVVVGPGASQAAALLSEPAFHVTEVDPAAGEPAARTRLRDGKAVVAVVTGRGTPLILMDGSQLFSVQAAETALGRMAGRAGVSPRVEILYNRDLSTSWVMVPGLAGLIVATVDLVAIIAIGMGVFHVPFTGNVGTFALGAGLFLLVTLGTGVLVSTVSQNQGQAIQLAFMLVLPQVLLSGLIFPVSSMGAGVRWISYVLPLTYFNEISRGVMLKAMPISDLWEPLGLLAVLAVVVLGLAVFRFRRDLAPSGRTVTRAQQTVTS
jgi:ABC-2 type transport system permease protein